MGLGRGNGGVKVGGGGSDKVQAWGVIERESKITSLLLQAYSNLYFVSLFTFSGEKSLGFHGVRVI